MEGGLLQSWARREKKRGREKENLLAILQKGSQI
jgi:hypothetical protein